MKLAVGITWESPFMFSETVDSILGLERPDGYEIKFFRGRGWCPARRHNSVCEQALEWGAELILLIGGDEVYEPDLIKRIVARYEEGYEMVAAMVPCRGFVSWNDMKPFQPMAWQLVPQDGIPRPFRSLQQDPDLVRVIKREDGDIVPVNFIGSGCIFFQRGHLEAMSRPWFSETLLEDEGFNRVSNQDCRFIWRLQLESAARCWVDTTIMIKHLHIFAIDDTYQERFADWAREGVGDPRYAKFKKPGDLPLISYNELVPLRIKTVLNMMGPLEGKSIFDVGCGKGAVTNAFVKAGAGRVVGVDPNIVPQYTTFEFYPVKAEEMIDLMSEEFDFVHVGEVFEHIEEPEKLLEKLVKRWPNATYILSVPSFTAQDHLRTYDPKSFDGLFEPYLKADDKRTIQWKVKEDSQAWFIVKGRPHEDSPNN